MNEASLAEAVQRPELHRRLLGKYKGAYALGVTRIANGQRCALHLRIEGPVPPEIPQKIAVDGEEVPVVVEGGFKAPRAL
jgi:hypothetical protein